MATYQVNQTKSYAGAVGVVDMDTLTSEALAALPPPIAPDTEGMVT